MEMRSLIAGLLCFLSIDCFAASSTMKFDDLMRDTEKQIADKNYPKALEFIKQSENILNQQGDKAEILQWAYLFDYKRYCLYEIGEKEKALEVCQKAIVKLAKVADWAYLAEYNVVRATKRACYNMLAWESLKEASNEAELQQSIDFITQCFSTISPIEDQSVLNPFYETKALVYQKAARFNSEKYQLLFFQSLEDLEKNNADFEVKTLAKDLTCAAYLDYKKHLQSINRRKVRTVK